MKMSELGGRGRGRRRNKPAESRFMTASIQLHEYIPNSAAKHEVPGYAAPPGYGPMVRFDIEIEKPFFLISPCVTFRLFMSYPYSGTR